MQELNSLFVTRHGVLTRELSFYPKPPNKTLDITTNNSGEIITLENNSLQLSKLSAVEKNTQIFILKDGVP